MISINKKQQFFTQDKLIMGKSAPEEHDLSLENSQILINSLNNVLIHYGFMINYNFQIFKI